MASAENNVITWFEIPVTNIQRAMKFYCTVFSTDMKEESFGPMKMAIFPKEGPGVHGALVQGEDYTPGNTGAVVYFDGGDDLSGPLSKVTAAGGKILKNKLSIGPHGFMAVVLDTEGNRIALHSMK
jgi:uncharacterized protein